MCGVIGAAWWSGPPLPQHNLRAATRALAHRGPDGHGIWRGQGAALAHTRLSIIDLDHGAQPLHSEDGQVSVVVNGELYGFEAIRAELQKRGHRFATGSDSEIVLHLYEDLGLDMVHQLRGEFALIVWDARTRRLIAARDRFGVKPLCYTRRPDGALWLASEAKALHALGHTARWDVDMLWQAAQMQYLSPDRTLFDGIKQLPPGHLLIASEHDLSLRPYWQLDYPIEPTPAYDAADEAAWIAATRDAIDESVSLRLRADVPIACALSGGIDSCAVAAIAQRHLSAPLPCFTLSFDSAPYDELPVATAVARAIGANLHPVPVSALDLLDALPDAIHHAEGLAINGHLAAKFILSREVRRAGFRVTLSGEGSDELFAGYPHLRQDLFATQHHAEHLRAKLAATNTATAGIFSATGPGLSLAAVTARLGYTPAFMAAKASLGARITSLMTPDARAAMPDASARFIASFPVEAQLEGRHPVHQSMVLWTKLALANYILRHIGDGAEMAHGVEGRLPLLDHKLAERVIAMPLSMKIRGDVEKYALREATRGLLPELVRNRQKHPLLATPLALDLSGRSGEWARDLARSAAMASLPGFDPRAILATLDAIPHMSRQEQIAWDPALMTLFSACLAQQRFSL